MGVEGDRPKGSGWQRWRARSAGGDADSVGGGADVGTGPAADGNDDMDVQLVWPAGHTGTGEGWGADASAAGDEASSDEPGDEPAGTDAAGVVAGDSDDADGEPDDADEVHDEAAWAASDADADEYEPDEAPDADEYEPDEDPDADGGGDEFDDTLDEAFGATDPLDDAWGADDEDEDEFGVSVERGGLPVPTMSGRLDAVETTVHSLGLRLEALVGATSSLRNALADRIDDYASTVSRLSLTQARDLDEYRRANERAIAELRRSAAATDESISRVEARLDELSADVAALADIVRAASRAPTPARADDAVHRLEAALDDLRHDLAGLVATAQGAEVPPPPAAAEQAPPPAPAEVPDDVVGLLVEVRDLVVAILDGLPGSAEGSAADPAAELVALRSELSDVRRAVTKLARATAVLADPNELAERVVAALKAEYEVEIADAPGSEDAPAAGAGRRGRRRA